MSNEIECISDSCDDEMENSQALVNVESDEENSPPTQSTSKSERTKRKLTDDRVGIRKKLRLKIKKNPKSLLFPITEDYEVGEVEEDGIKIWFSKKNEDAYIREDIAILSKKSKRPHIIPIQDDKLWELYQAQFKIMWNTNSINFEKDLNDYGTLSVEEQTSLDVVLTFFSNVDMIVSENLTENFISEIQLNEANHFLGLQRAIENEHTVCYGEMVKTLYMNTDAKKFNRMRNSVIEHEATADIAFWIKKYTTKNKVEFRQRLVAFIILEGVMLSGLFAILFKLKSLKKSNILEGIMTGNTYIFRDENLHCLFGCYLYKEYVVEKLPLYHIMEMLDEAKESMRSLYEEICEGGVMSYDDLEDYINYIIYGILTEMGYVDTEITPFPLYYNRPCPLSFMTKMGMYAIKNDFFSSRTTEYLHFVNKTTKSEVQEQIKEINI